MITKGGIIVSLAVRWQRFSRENEVLSRKIEDLVANLRMVFPDSSDPDYQKKMVEVQQRPEVQELHRYSQALPVGLRPTREESSTPMDIVIWANNISALLVKRQLS